MKVRRLRHNSIGEVYHAIIAAMVDENVHVSVEMSSEVFRAKTLNFTKSIVGTKQLVDQFEPSMKEIGTTYLTPILKRFTSAHVDDFRDRILISVKSHNDIVEEYIRNCNLNNDVNKVLLWIRRCTFECWRNNTIEITRQMIAYLSEKFLIIPIGDLALDEYELWKNECDGADILWDPKYFSNERMFMNDESFQLQLFLYYTLREKYGLVGSIGLLSGAMDGPCFMGMPTVEIGPKRKLRKRMTKIFTADGLKKHSLTVPLIGNYCKDKPIERLEDKEVVEIGKAFNFVI